MSKLRKLTPIFFLSLFFLLETNCHASLTSDLHKILDAPELRSGLDGVVVADVKTGKILFQQNSDKLMIPASNRKLFTAASALAILGKDQVETTDILATAASDQLGTIRGDIFIRGGGDPLLSVKQIDQITKTIADSGVTYITGSVIADNSLFGADNYGDGWQVDSLLGYYSPEIMSLEVNEGIATLSFHSGVNTGDKTTFDLDPHTNYLTIENQVLTGEVGSAVNYQLDRSLTGTHITATGSIPPGVSPDPNNDDTDGRITVPNPALFAATILSERLQERGIKITGGVSTGNTPTDAVVLASHKSPTIAELMPLMLKPSDNLIAECLIRLEAVHEHMAGAYQNGKVVEDKYFASIGIGSGVHNFTDGSGVSRLNYVTPSAEMTLLLYEAKQATFPIFYNSLSIAGVDGTASGRLKKTLAFNNAHVKTGTVRNCRSFSGYVKDRSGHLLAFVILMNNHLLSAHMLGAYQDKIVTRLAENS